MKSLYCFIFSLTPILSFTQTRISGTVIDQRNEPVPMASVFIQDTYDGTTADINGNFRFTTEEKGSYTLVIKSIGLKEFHKPIVLDGNPIQIFASLEEAINELTAVTISAGSFTASDESRRTVFRAIDIATTAGATADIAGALNTLPGTQKNGESGRLFVRGGDGNEAKTFIDGLLVMDAYSPSAPNTPSRGRFLPFMFKGTSFSTGGYSSEYGQALSSALVLESKDESEITRTDIGILSVGGDVTHTQAWKGGSIAGKIQYTNLRPYTNFINQRIDWKDAPASAEGIAALRQKVGERGMFKVYGNYNDSEMSLYNHDIDNYRSTQLYQLNNRYRYANASYKDLLNKNWMIRGGLSYTYQNNNITVGTTVLRENEKGVHAKAVLEGSLTDQIELKTGAEILSREYDYSIGPESSTPINVGFSQTLTAVFAESDLYASNKFVTRIGGRAEHNNLTNSTSVDPRISLAYKTGVNGQLSLAYGTFRQSVKNDYLRFDQNLLDEKAEHFILNYQRIENNKTFRVETYYKKYNDLLKIESGQFSNNGSGYAKGVELFWRDNESVDHLDYWVSYSYLDTERDYLNFPTQATPSFASKHNFSIVGKYFVQKLKSQIGTTWSYTSGRPYNDPNKATFNGSKTASYQDLSLNWSYLPKPYLIVYFSCTNLLGRDNIFGYEFSSSLNEHGAYNSRAIRQPAPRFLFLGIFITLTKDKSVNQLPAL